MPSLRDRCCYFDAQEKSKWWLICLAIGFSVAVVLAAIVLLVLRFTVIPNIKATVEDARLNSFAVATTQSGGTTTSFFAYNISVALSVDNPNRAMSIKITKPLVAAFVFNDRRLSNVTAAGEGHNYPPRKTEVHLLHTGGQVPSDVLGTATVEEFKKQNTTGVFKVEVRLTLELTLGIANKRKLGLSCPLNLHLAPPGAEVIVFHEVNCKPAEHDEIYF